MSTMITGIEELSLEVERLKQLLSDADEAAAIALERQVATAVERVRADLSSDTDKLRLELESLTKQRDYAHRLLAETEEAAAIALERQVAAAVEQLRAELDEEHRAVLTIQKNAADEMRAEFASERDTMRQEIDHLRQSAIRALDESRSPAAEHEAAAPSAHGQPEHVRIFAEALKKMSSIFERDVSAVVQRGVLELMAETDRLRSDLEQVADYASQLEGDRNRVTDECQRVKRQLDEAKASGPGSKAPTPDAIQTEIARVEGLLNALSDIIVDPGADLTEGIRRNAERTELESYLRGIRFSLHG